MSEQQGLFDKPKKKRPVPYAKGSSTSIAAAMSIDEDALTAMERKVYDAIKARPGGLTCDEVEQFTGMTHQSASARVNGLARDGVLRDSGRKRPTRSGRQAVVYMVNDGKHDDSGAEIRT